MKVIKNNKIKLTLEDGVFDTINYILLGILGIMFLYPIVYVFSAAVSTPYQVETGQVVLFPKGFHLDSPVAAMNLDLFWISYLNTIIIVVGGTLVSMFFTILGAYVLSKENLKFRSFWIIMVVFTMWFDPGMIPRYLNFRDLGLINTYTSVLVGFAVNTFNVIILKSFFESVPKSLEESARIDGANQFQVLWNIYMPLSAAALTTVSLFYAVSRWNGYFWTMILLTDERKAPIQVFLKKLVVDRVALAETNALITPESLTSPTTIIYSVIVLSIIPMMILYPFVQGFFKKGVNIGAVKE